MTTNWLFNPQISIKLLLSYFPYYAY